VIRLDGIGLGMTRLERVGVAPSVVKAEMRRGAATPKIDAVRGAGT